MLARYSLGAVCVAELGLMAQQRTFHQHGMPHLGGPVACDGLFRMAIGQFFVRQTPLVPPAIKAACSGSASRPAFREYWPPSWPCT
jgi:hypothetical protein